MALRFLTLPPPQATQSTSATQPARSRLADDQAATSTGVILGFRDGSSQTLDSSSPAGRAFRALAEVLALRSRTVRVGEET